MPHGAHRSAVSASKNFVSTKLRSYTPLATKLASFDIFNHVAKSQQCSLHTTTYSTDSCSDYNTITQNGLECSTDTAICLMLLPIFNLLPCTSPSSRQWHCGNWRPEQAANTGASHRKQPRCSTPPAEVDSPARPVRRSNTRKMCARLPPLSAPRSPSRRGKEGDQSAKITWGWSGLSTSS